MPRDRSKDIRELIRIFFVALGLLVVLNLAATYAGDAVLHHSAFRFSRILTGKIDVDLLIAGNSRGVNLLTARDAGSKATVFNLSYNGLNGASSLALVQEFFLRGNKASAVAIEVSTLGVEGGSCYTKPYWGQMPMLAAANAAACSQDAQTARYLPLTRFDSELFLRALYYATVHARTDQDWADQYRMNSAQCRRYHEHGDASKLRPFVSQDVGMLWRRLAAFQGWMAQHAPGTRIVYVLAPFLSTPATVGDVDTLVAAEDKVFGGNFLDLSKALGGNCDDFADLFHLSAVGRPRIVDPLIAYVRRVRGVPDFRRP